MRFAIIVFVAIAFIGCAPTVTESIISNTVHRDTTFHPQIIHDTAYVYDEEFMGWINQELGRLYAENDSLRGRKPDTLKIKEYLKSRPLIGKWEIFRVTPNGDSVWVTFRLRNKDGTFEYRVVPAPMKAILSDTNTIKTQEKQPTWYEKIWEEFKDFILYGIIAILAFSLAYQKFRA